MGTPIDFVQKFHEIPIGQFKSYPVDETAIRAFDITEDEMEEYYNEKYLKVHWGVMLERILQKRQERRVKQCE